MRKLFGLAFILGATVTLSACGAIPECRQELDECTYGGPYTEERTVEAGKRVAVVAPAPAIPVIAPTPAPVPAPVVAPVPAPIRDIEVIRSAEPQFKQISK